MITLKKEISISGNGLMKNKPCTVTFKPSKEGKIRYFVKDNEPFEAAVENVISTDHCVTLGKGKARAMLEEHLSAALALCEIDSLDIYMTEEEVPILDGSSKGWVELFKSAGIDKPLLYKPKKYTVTEPVYYLNGKTSLVVLPDDELFISYAVNYDHPDLKNRWVNVDFKKLDEIRDARTFGFYKDLKKFQMLGFAQGVTQENTVLRSIYSDGTGLRSASAVVNPDSNNIAFIGSGISDETGKSQMEGDELTMLMTAYYRQYLQAINEQDTSLMCEVTDSYREAIVDRISSDANQSNYYDPSQFQIEISDGAIQYADDFWDNDHATIRFNMKVDFVAQDRRTQVTTPMTNYQTILLLWDNGMWKVDQSQFITVDQYNGNQFANFQN